MRIEPKAAFYNEETGAVQPWKDIEVTDSVGNALVSEGLAIAIAEGGGGGGETITWILDNATATVAYDSYLEDYFAKFTLPDSITADNLISTFAGKQSVTIVDGFKVEAPANAADQDAKVAYFATLYGQILEFDMHVPDGLYCAVPSTSDDVGKTVTLSLGVVED